MSTGRGGYGGSSAAGAPRSSRPSGEADSRGRRLMATKRQTTFAKMDRERAVREKRARKQEKKDAAKAAKAAGGAEPGTEPGTEPASDPEVSS
jgi:hypothetical protein